jgi:hypothetical protein
MSQTLACQSCAAEFAGGNFCARCGQRAPRSDDFTLRSFGRELWEEGTGSDSRLWRTVLGLFRPGVLTQAFLQYRWQQFLPPLRLYLLMSALFFLLAWDAYFAGQLTQMRNAPAGAIPPELGAMFADPATAGRISNWAAFFRFAGVLALGGLVKLLHWRKPMPVGQHLAFATHYYCADYAIYLLAAPALYLAPAASYEQVMGIVAFAGMIWLLWWAVLADRRVYGGGWAGNVMRGVLILCADLVISLVAGQLALLAVFVAYR